MSAREFELCRSRPRQGRVRCRLQRRNFRIGFYRIRTEIRPTGHRLPIANSAIRCAAPRARRPPRAGRRGASGLGRERPHAYAAPSASPGSRYTPVRRVSRVPRRIRNRAEENKGRERPRDRSKRPDPLGCQATRHSRTRPSRPRLDTHQARRRSTSTDHGSISNTSGAWRPIALGESQPNLADMPSDSIEVITSNKFRLICW